MQNAVVAIYRGVRTGQFLTTVAVVRGFLCPRQSWALRRFL